MYRDRGWGYYIIGSSAVCGGGGDYTVGNNTIYNSRGLDSGLEKMFPNYSIKACF